MTGTDGGHIVASNCGNRSEERLAVICCLTAPKFGNDSGIRGEALLHETVWRSLRGKALSKRRDRAPRPPPLCGGGGHIAPDCGNGHRAEAINCSKEAESMPMTSACCLSLDACGAAIEGGGGPDSVCSSLLRQRLDSELNFLGKRRGRSSSDCNFVRKVDEVNDCSWEGDGGESRFAVPEHGKSLGALMRSESDMRTELLHLLSGSLTGK